MTINDDDDIINYENESFTLLSEKNMDGKKNVTWPRPL